jgi:hypothetical protein
MSIDQLRSSFAEPPTGSAPMMRWWWFGPSVDRAEIDRELAVMAGAGLGGVEVAFVYPLSQQSERFLSAQSLADLRYAAEAARRHGLRFDLTLGSGWSFGGPHITAEHAARRLVWERREIIPGPMSIPVAAPWPGDELVAAYLGPGSLQEPPDQLSQLPVVDGFLEVPEGTGTRSVLLAYAQLTGQNVKRAANGAEGPVLDHYSAAAARRHLEHVGDPLLDAVPAHLLGSVFCDSLEVYGSDWTPEMAAEFRRRRGYDLLPELYRLVVDGPGAAQLRADYHRTLSELYEDHFVAVLRSWAAERGVLFRIQGYGTPPAMISSYRRADLFEGEGWGWTELTQTRWASSAAHLYGLDVVSSETWTWVHSPSFRATPLDLKGEAHEHLLAGINQFVGHGWPHSPRRTGAGLGWFFYAAAALDDRNPWWPAMAPLVRYLTRLCWLMRQGAPAAEVLVYVSSEDVFARMGTAGGGSLDAWREARQVVGDDVIRVIRQGSWDFDLVDDEALTVLPAEASRPVVISGATSLPAESQAWFERYASAGGSVITVGSTVGIAGATACKLSDLAALLWGARPPDVRLDPGATDIGVVRRRTAEAEICLVVNTGPSLQSVALTPLSARTRYEEWDAHTGGVIRSGRVADGVGVRLHPYQATVIVLSDQASLSVSPETRSERGRQRTVLSGQRWQVQFGDEDSMADVDLPHVWESDPGRRAFSGLATYKTTVELPDLGPDVRVEIDFGDGPAVAAGSAEPRGLLGHSYRAGIDPPVGVIAEVHLNGVACGLAWAPPYVVDVTAAVRPGRNQIEITIANTAANALAHDEHVAPMVAEAERRYGRRFRMQELERAMDGVKSGLIEVPTMLITG